MNKRNFIKGILGMGITSPFHKDLLQWIEKFNNVNPLTIASDEEFWAKVRSGYRLKPDYINLENGYYCFAPQETIDNFIHHVERVNYEGSYYMRTVQKKNKDYVAGKLARLMGADKEEVIVTRNTTESLDTIISGYDWKEGDEAVFAVHDYGAMRNQFMLMERRYGIKNNIVTVPLHPKSDSEIVETYAKAITQKTKLLMVCHMINITGQILPIRKICDMAHARGVDVMVDGAHAYAHINFNVKDLDCDYYGSSLHKWLSVPLGAGLLYVKKEKIKHLWPMFAEWGKDEDDIRKLNHTGTHPVHTDLSIANAVEYYELIGADRKESRLRYIQNYWVDRLRGEPGIIINTPVEKHRSCGIANVGVEKMTPKDMEKTLMDTYNIWTVAIDNKEVKGCRITPNIYTTLTELDQFVAAVKEMAG